MYKAIHRDTGEAIILLQPRWARRLSEIQQLDRQDRIVCQGCRQPVRARMGKIRRWHFAHKHLQNCTYGHESPALLNARAVLYGWLAQQFGDRVAVEHQVNRTSLPRPIDCWVDTANGPFGYWIIEGAMQPDIRSLVTQGLGGLQVRVSWVFCAQMLRSFDETEQQIHLTTTEREFMRSSEFDQPYQSQYALAGRSLHYLDADQSSLITYRNLRLVHEPQLFAGHRQVSDLNEVVASATTGEFVHAGEAELLRIHQEQLEKLEQAKQQKEAAAGARQTLSLRESVLGNVAEPGAGSRDSLCLYNGLDIDRR
jgi:hypothetical protein